MTKRKSTKRKTMAEFKDEVREKFGSKYIISGKYINNKTNIHVFKFWKYLIVRFAGAH